MNENIVVGESTLKDLVSFEKDYIIQIPDYQRPYVWTTNKAKELLDDFEAFYNTKHDGDMYYMGCILFHEKDERTYDIIDGQQRLSTLFILDQILNGDASSLCQFRENLCLNFNSPESVKNIKEIQKYFKIWKNSSSNRFPLLFEHLVFSIIITKSQDDAFTFFDTQNNRGVKLSSVDFLKSFHLREIKESEDKQRIFAKKWDRNNQNQFLNTLFNQVIWRGRRWKGKNVNYENTDLILEEFQKKTINKKENGDITIYAGSKNKFANILSFDKKLGLNIQPLAISFQTETIDLPFSLRQPIEKGASFFLYTEKYTALYHHIFSKEHPYESELYKLIQFYTHVYRGSRISDYLKMLYKLCVVMYYDKFEDQKIYSFGLWLDYLLGSYRIRLKSIVSQTPVVIIRDLTYNLLDVISSAYLPEEVFEFLKDMTNEDIYKNEDIIEGYGVRERYKNQLLTYFDKKLENSKKLTHRKSWNYDTK